MISERLKHIMIVVLMLGFFSCKKDVLTADTLPFTTYDTYNPKNFSWSENGLYFTDGYISFLDSNYYFSVFGFDQDGQFKFKTSQNQAKFIDDEYYESSKVFGVNVENTGVFFGAALKGSTTDLHFQKFDIMSGSTTDLFIVPFDHPTPNLSSFDDFQLKETSTGYVCLITYEYNSTTLLCIYQFDHEFNLIDHQDFNNLPNNPINFWLEAVTILPNDEIIILYSFNSLGSNNEKRLYIRKHDSNLNFIWSVDLSATYSDIVFTSEINYEPPLTPSKNFDMQYQDGKLLIYSVLQNITFDPSTSAAFVDTDPVFFSIDASSGLPSAPLFFEEELVDENGDILSLDNLHNFYLSPNGELTICGYTISNGLTTGISIQLNSNLELIDYYTISDISPATMLNFSGFNTSGERIFSGVSPRYVNSNFPDYQLDDLNAFVGKVDENGSIIPE